MNIKETKPSERKPVFSEELKCFIAIAAGVPYKIEGNRIVTAPCDIRFDGGKLIVAYLAN